MVEIQTTTDYFKFCPGEEQIKISNAICRGRRRSSFPKCPGCQFNDDEKIAPPVTIMQERAKTVSLVEGLFRQTDISGVVPLPLSEEAAWRIGYACAQYLHGKLRGHERADPVARSIIVGRDARVHSEALQKSLIDGILAAGMDVMQIGLIDTPAIFFAANHLKSCGGIVTTGGIDPADCNGFVVCGPKGAPVGAEMGLSAIRDLAMRIPRHAPASSARQSEYDLSPHYHEFLLAHLQGGRSLPRRLKIVIDANNGLASRDLPLVLQHIDKLRTKLILAHCGGPAIHDPDPLAPDALGDLKRAVRETKADFGVALSPDAMITAFVDERAQSIPPDLVAGLIGRAAIERRPGSTIVVDHRFSSLVIEDLQRAGGNVIRERATVSHIRKRMTEAHGVFGADLTGRYYFQQNAYCESAYLAIIQMINLLAASTERRLSYLVRPYQRSRTSGEVRFRCVDVEKVMRELTLAHADARFEELDGLTIRYDDWWLNVRGDTHSPTLNVTVEAKSRKLIEQRLAELEPFVGERIFPEFRSAPTAEKRK